MDNRDLMLYSYLKGKQPAPTPTPTDKEISGEFSVQGGAKLLNGRYLSGMSAAFQYFPLAPTGAIPLYDSTKPFKLHLRVKNSKRSKSQALCGNSGTSYFYYPSIELTPNPNFLGAGYSESGNGWTDWITITTTEMPYDANKWYDIEYEWTGTKLNISVSDGTITATKTRNASQICVFPTYRFALGNVANSNSLYAEYVTYDLNNCYWEQDGTLLWGNKE